MHFFFAKMNHVIGLRWCVTLFLPRRSWRRRARVCDCVVVVSVVHAAHGLHTQSVPAVVGPPAETHVILETSMVRGGACVAARA